MLTRGRVLPSEILVKTHGSQQGFSSQLLIGWQESRPQIGSHAENPGEAKWILTWSSLDKKGLCVTTNLSMNLKKLKGGWVNTALQHLLPVLCELPSGAIQGPYYWGNTWKKFMLFEHGFLALQSTLNLWCLIIFFISTHNKNLEVWSMFFLPLFCLSFCLNSFKNVHVSLNKFPIGSDFGKLSGIVCIGLPGKTFWFAFLLEMHSTYRK